MSSKTSRTALKSEAETKSRAETEDVEELQVPTAYDRLPAVISTFPAVFHDLEIEQRYWKTNSCALDVSRVKLTFWIFRDRREIDEQRVKDLRVAANTLLLRVEREEQARIDADLSVEKIYQQGIATMYKNVRAPMRSDFAAIGAEIVISNERLALAM